MHDDNNTSHRATVRGAGLFVLQWVADGGPMPTEAQRVDQRFSNWLTLVLHSAGTNDELSAHLPPEIRVPVWVDSVSRRIVSIDTDVAEAELEQFRDVARKEWKETDAPLADVRNMIAMPGAIMRGLKRLPSSVRSTAGEIKGGLSNSAPPREPTAQETEQLRRTSIALGYSLEQNPKQHAQMRAAALQAAPSLIESTRQGQYGNGNFENWLMMQTLSRVITEDEAASFRAAAGLGPTGSAPPPTTG